MKREAERRERSVAFLAYEAIGRYVSGLEEQEQAKMEAVRAGNTAGIA